VDGRNPAPAGRWFIQWFPAGAGFLAAVSWIYPTGWCPPGMVVGL